MLRRVYLDASVVLAIANYEGPLADEAVLILDKAEEIHSSVLVDLEVLAPSRASGRTKRVERINRVLSIVTHFHSVTETTWQKAMDLASQTIGLSAADAIHLALCQEHNAIFLNAERPERAPNRISGVESRTIYQGGV
ncbi:MAG: PIN domain-containing protein [Planctomycetes bacterium]|nr:PIN domain-containing protein [Planctomycetota bacterium]